MNFSRLVKIACLFLILHSAAFVSSRAQSQVSRGNATPQIEQREILFAVIDKDLRVVDNLRAEDVRLLEDDQPQEIIAFQKLNDRPLSLAILIDTSASQEKTLPKQKLAADSFVQATMRPGQDQAAIVTFSGKVTIEQGLTGDVSLIRQAISRARFVAPPGYRAGNVIVGRLPPPQDPTMATAVTAVWDAIWTTCRDLLAPASPESRKAIILLSDGDDTFSNANLSEAIERAVKADVAVYSIGIGDRYNFGINEAALRKLSDQTGGQAFFPSKPTYVEDALATIKALLYLQYKVSYRSLATWKKSPQKIRLELINPTLAGKALHLSYQVLTPPRQR